MWHWQSIQGNSYTHHTRRVYRVFISYTLVFFFFHLFPSDPLTPRFPSMWNENLNDYLEERSDTFSKYSTIFFFFYKINVMQVQSVPTKILTKISKPFEVREARNCDLWTWVDKIFQFVEDFIAKMVESKWLKIIDRFRSNFLFTTVENHFLFKGDTRFWKISQKDNVYFEFTKFTESLILSWLFEIYLISEIIKSLVAFCHGNFDWHHHVRGKQRHRFAIM